MQRERRGIDQPIASAEIPFIRAMEKLERVKAYQGRSRCELGFGLKNSTNEH